MSGSLWCFLLHQDAMPVPSPTAGTKHVKLRDLDVTIHSATLKTKTLTTSEKAHDLEHGGLFGYLPRYYSVQAGETDDIET
ncbi:hypothetical protein CDEST_07929 [Colletotrichum destructivum]|uniref:Uncharacterized protein n=1 Tax=Colletotrichum destructivum TaxID=34406 RepID=A0AAX4IHH6_9PEZI|nr:hypothetical protein CDEST_07929 [Colletotrichum destructivum]